MGTFSVPSRNVAFSFCFVALVIGRLAWSDGGCGLKYKIKM